MNQEEHRKRHAELHTAIDELIADWITDTGRRPSQGTVLDLLTWSHAQSLQPRHEHPDDILPETWTAEPKVPNDPDYAYRTVEDYENVVGFHVTEAFRMAWRLARLTVKDLQNLEKSPCQT